MRTVCMPWWCVSQPPEYCVHANPFSPGDLSNWGWDDKEGGMGSTCRPLGVEVYRLADEKVLGGWKPPQSPAYKGMHGMSMPTRDPDGLVGL